MRQGDSVTPIAFIFYIFFITVLNFSTSSQVVFAVKDPKIPDKPDSSQPIQYFPYFGGKYIAVAASLNGGNVLSKFVDMLVSWSNDFGKFSYYHNSQINMKTPLSSDIFLCLW